jgi:hypothetical protein
MMKGYRTLSWLDDHFRVSRIFQERHSVENFDTRIRMKNLITAMLAKPLWIIVASVILLGIGATSWIAVSYYRNNAPPPEEFIKERYLSVVKTRVGTALGWSALPRLTPGAPRPNLDALKETVARMSFNSFAIADSQRSEVNRVPIYKARIIASVKFGESVKNLDEWITFERTDKGWVLFPGIPGEAR